MLCPRYHLHEIDPGEDICLDCYIEVARAAGYVGPVYVSAHISAMSAKLLAAHLYRIAVRGLSLDQVTHEEWFKGKIEPAEIGVTGKKDYNLPGQA